MLRLTNKTPAPRPQGASPGFSLIEVVVSFMILALALGVLLTGLSTGVRGTGRAAEASLALLYAESLLAEAGTSVALAAGENSGAHPGGYRWRRAIRPFPSAARLKGITPFEVAVSVTPPGGGASVELVSLRIKIDAAMDGAAP